MSITRFHPPFWPGTKDHMPMDRSSKGVFVLYKDHKFRVDRLLARIEELERRLKTETKVSHTELEAPYGH